MSIVGRVAGNFVVIYFNNIIDLITSREFSFTTSSLGIRMKLQLINSAYMIFHYGHPEPKRVPKAPIDACPEAGVISKAAVDFILTLQPTI